MTMFTNSISTIEAAKKIVIVQAENPDGNSLGTSVALEEILGDLGKIVVLHCPVEIPKYLRYIQGWDRVEKDFPYDADCAIIVDTTAEVLLSKTLAIPAVRNFFESHQVIAIDHHPETSSLNFSHELIYKDAVSTSAVVYELALSAGWPVSARAAENMLIAIMSDSLGLTTPNVTTRTFEIATELIRAGASNAVIEERRREYMKKSPEILAYKGNLIGRIEYHLDGKLAMVHIPWEDIQTYSDQYNPSVLVLDEMRLVENVEVCIAVKTYPDGKLTGKLKTNLPIAGNIAGYFGGGGHDYAAGFRIYEPYSSAKNEIIAATDKILRDFNETL